MPTIKYHVARVHSHVKQHHKKYLAGIFGWYAVVKLVLLVMWLTVVQHSLWTQAQLDTGCVLTGQYYTWEVQTWCTRVPEQVSEGTLEWCITIPGYWTGGSVNESGDLVNQTRVEETQTGCSLTGQTTIPGYWTWCTTTPGYWTGGTVVCQQDQQTGDTNDDTLPETTKDNGVCESADIVWKTPYSGSILKDSFPITWEYSWNDCRSIALSLQVLDHNQQWISLNTTTMPTLVSLLSASTITTGSMSYQFNSLPFVQYQNSWLYHVMGTTMSGINYVVYTGLYTWLYTDFYTWYTLKLVDNANNVLHQTTPFTIDNRDPSVTGYTLTSNTSAISGYLNEDATITFAFTGSEELVDIEVTLWKKAPSTEVVSWLRYTYTWDLTSSYPEGYLPLSLSYADLAGNTWALVYTSSLIFDTTTPVVTGLVFSQSGGKIYLAYSWSELTNYRLTYQQKNDDDDTIVSWASYLTAQKLSFGTLEATTIYTFDLDIFDRAGNIRQATGDVKWTSTWAIVSHISLIYGEDETDLNTHLSQLAVVLKAEVKKFNACKDKIDFTDVDVKVKNTTYTLQMPAFQKSQMKKIVNAFTLFILDEVKNKSSISKSDIQKITDKFDNFLVVLKLLRDDDNSCQQNLSNYHIVQFKHVLELYDITID